MSEQIKTLIKMKFKTTNIFESETISENILKTFLTENRTVI